MYERIPHPTDGAQPPRAATENALGLAESHDATRCVLQVGEDPPASRIPRVQ